MLTKEEFENNYSEVEVVFSSYYKYSFSFVGEHEDGTHIICSYGGCTEDIYRYEVSNNSVETVGSLDDNWMSVVARKDGDVIFEWFDY